MNNILLTTEIAQLRYADYRRDAAMDRLALEALAGAPARQKNWIGRWGSALLHLFRLRRNDQMWTANEGRLPG